jgi:endonuclease/exonuclease/phosphatase family metal-dependent hydrolase
MAISDERQTQQQAQVRRTAARGSITPPPSPPAATAQATAATATAADSAPRPRGCSRRFRLLVWNVQQANARRASDVVTRDVLRFAAEAQFDAVALNEVFHDVGALKALSEPLGYPHVALHRGRHGSRLGVVGAAPLTALPVRHTAGHGALCVSPSLRYGNISSMPASSHEDDPPTVCVAHLSPNGESTRMQELTSLLGALPSKGKPALLVGDLNALSPLDFLASTPSTASPLPPTSVAAAAADAPVAASAPAFSAATSSYNTSGVLETLRASKKLKRKFLNAGGAPALKLVGTLLREGMVDLAHLGASSKTSRPGCAPTWRAGPARQLQTAEEEELLRLEESPPPPPPITAAQLAANDRPALRIDYAFANAALVARCRKPSDSPTSTTSAGDEVGWGVWASVVPEAALAKHGLVAASEHSPIQVVVGGGLPAGLSPADADRSLRAQAAAGAESGAASLRPTKDAPSTAAADHRRPSSSSSPSTASTTGEGGGSRTEHDPAFRVGGKPLGISEKEIGAMPGGTPRNKAVDGAACDELGSGKAAGLARLKAELGSDGAFSRRCQALSGVLRLHGLRRRFRSCAVVGGSGILRQYPQGSEIDKHEAIFRVNNCPVGGFERLVGSRTSVRFINGPRSIMWGREISQQKGKGGKPKAPPELLHNDHTVMWGEPGTLDRLRSAMPSNASLVRANTRFRRECADKTFWSADELDQHRASNKVARLEITFGFEAVSHALYSCESVDIFGFFLDPDDAERQTNAAETSSSAKGGRRGKAMATPYHYYENSTYDKSAKDPWRPWTYKYHNFGLEHQKFRQLEAACFLRIVTDET